MRHALAATLSAVIVVVCARHPQAQPVSTRELLDRAALYTRQFVTRLSNVVAEERYVQEFLRTTTRRSLISEFLLVGYPGAEGSFQVFRDVIEVNGRRVADQNVGRFHVHEEAARVS